MFSNFSYYLKKIINDSKIEMQYLKHSYIGTEHFILALLKTNTWVTNILNSYDITYNNFRNKVIEHIGYGNEKQNIFVYTPLFKKILEESLVLVNELKIKEIDIDMIVKLILDEGEGVAFRIFCEMNVNIDELYEEISSITISKNNSLITDYGINLTEKAKNNLIEPVIGREKEIDNIIEILLRKNKCNPILIGEAGVGKTAIVESLAERIVKSNVPKRLLNRKIISISMASLVAGTKYRGEFEEKLLSIIKEVEKNNNIILFIDEIHTLVGAGGAEGAIDASNILKPALSRGNISIIGATTKEEYRKYIEDDKALSRRFQKVLIEEPNEDKLLEILKRVKPLYEKHHNVIINNSILKNIINISKKYINDRKEPDRSIDLLDEVSSYVSSKPDEIDKKNNNLKEKLLKYKNKKEEMLINNNYNKALKYRKIERKIESIINDNELNKKADIKKSINKKDIIDVVNNKFNTLIDNKKELKRKLKNIDKDIVDKIIPIFNSNNNFIKPVSIVVNNHDDLLLKEISNSLFNNIILVDLNEFSDIESYNRIVGSSPGYVGYNNKKNIFESLKEQPFSLIIISNYEKACIRVQNIIKEILSKGYFIDNNGYRIDFMNSLIIIKTNILNSSIGFNNKVNNYNEIVNYVSDVINFEKASISMV